MIQAAGILYLTPDNQALFLKRGPGGDHAGTWCVPGGTTEEGETAEETAKREAREEAGPVPDGILNLLCRTTSAPGTEKQVDFTTFVQRVPEPFTPVVDPSESTGYAWAPVDAPPEPLHPGVRIALDRLTMDELGVARAMRDGRLSSPQRYENITMFVLRITGTGVAYRQALDEFVFRKPEIYLNQEFCDRCAGLPVIMEHPKGAKLTPKEFRNRNIGSVMFAWVQGDEVWAVARVMDDDAARIIIEHGWSTSPGVVLRGKEMGTKMTMEDGSKLLVEGKPALLDHIAVCPLGVWDKGGEPAGIVINDSVETGDKAMADKDEERKDADGTTADKLLRGIADAVGDIKSCMDSLTARVDSMESEAKADRARKDAADEERKADKARKDAEETERADKARKDAGEPEDEGKPEKVAADKARKDAEEEARKDSQEIRERIARVEAAMPRIRTDEERNALADAQSRADSVFAAFGDAAPRPMDGEEPGSYRRRLASLLAPRCRGDKLKAIDLRAVKDDAAFSALEEMVFADAMGAAAHPTDIAEGELRKVESRDATGRVITSFRGEPKAWMSEFGCQRRTLSSINRAA